MDSKKPILAILFDMDGVLFDSEPAYMELNARLMREAGYPVSREAQLQVIGTSMEETCRILAEDAGAPFSVDEMLAHFASLGKTSGIDYQKIVEADAHSVLSALKGLGLRLGLASSSDRETVNTALLDAGLMQYLDIAISANDVQNKKPAPDCFLLAASRMGISPAHCLVVEDTTVGVAAAKAAGMRVLGRVHQEYAQDLSSADALVDSLGQALHWIQDRLSQSQT